MPAEAVEPEMITVTEAARMLRVGRDKAYRLIRAGEFPVPVVKLGARGWSVSRPLVRRYIETGVPIRAAE